jgi:hypothetical protein
MNTALSKYWNSDTDAAPLAVFRILFGGIMLFSMLRFQHYGWIEKLYIEPQFFFSYLGFEWVKPLGIYTYGLFFLCGLAAFFVMIGWQYRVAIITFFLSFTYIELMDKTNYLNHYYFVSCIAFLLCFLPANARYSIDASRGLINASVPKWTIDSIKLMLSIVWFYAGLAKLNSDWLIEAQPLSIWLKAKYDIPVLGALLQKETFHYLFSWSGALYDLAIPFMLWYAGTRNLAFLAVVVFHILTWVLFPIGVFPWVMIGSALIFFDASAYHHFFRNLRKSFSFAELVPSPIAKGPRHSIVSFGQKTLPYSEVEDHMPIASSSDSISGSARRHYSAKGRWLVPGVLTLFFIVQIILPFRHLAYPGELFWTEEGYRFSWRVMLMEKAGYANFKVVDPETDRSFYVQNGNFLNPLQEKQMATQPDFILEFAHHLQDHFQREGINDPGIYVESYVALNGRTSRPFVDPTVDLTTIAPSLKPKTFILPFEGEIKGF